MVSFVAPMFLEGLLVFAIGAAFLITLTLLSIATLVGSGWSRRRVTSTAVGLFRSLIAKAVTLGRRSKLNAAERPARVVALRSLPPLVQLNMRIKAAGIVTRETALMPQRSTRPPRLPSSPLREPQFAGKLEDLAGLYLSPPEHALAWCCESRRLQAVDRAQPGGGRDDGEVMKARRNDLPGSTPLSDALCDLYGSVIGSCQPGRRHVEWLKFLRLVNRQTSRTKQLHVVCDNHATNDHPSIRTWLAAHPRFHVHFAQSSGSGLKMVKRFFSDVIAEQLGVRAFRSIAELTASISRHVKVTMLDTTPFAWVRKPERSPATGRGRQSPEGDQLVSITDAQDPRRAFRIK